MARVLITGGAGFIGSHAADALLRAGHDVVVLDNLSPQVHGADADRPEYLDAAIELIVGDIRNPSVVDCALKDVDRVLHLASAVGVGQSMYDIVSYVQINDVGTAVLLEGIARRRIERLVVASSMSVYGEGLCRDRRGRMVAPVERSAAQLRRGTWELIDENGDTLQPLPTPETKQPLLSSIYALNKYAQERMCLIAGNAYGIPTTALRFFNVFGPRQALSNPYTGVLAIFAARLLNSRSPKIFEDGLQRRDFVHVRDVARACVLALGSDHQGGVFNVGSGESRSILSVASDLAEVMGRPQLTAQVTRQYRIGDIRHCFADIRHAAAILEFSPSIDFRSGLEELAEYLAGRVAEDHVESATNELVRRGLVA